MVNFNPNVSMLTHSTDNNNQSNPSVKPINPVPHDWHLIRLRENTKEPAAKGHFDIPRLTQDQITSTIRSGRNLGVIPGRSGLVVLDADDAQALEALVAAGLVQTVRTGGSQNPNSAHNGGGHFYFRVPEGAEVQLAKHGGVELANGGLVDVIAHNRAYVVVPPSAVDGYAYEFLTDPTNLPVLPAWMYSGDPAPSGLEALQGVLDPANHVKTTPVAAEDLSEATTSLTADVDGIAWADAIGSAPLVYAGTDDDCEVWKLADEGHARRSVVCHSGGCSHVGEARIAVVWSDTLKNRYPEFSNYVRGSGQVAVSPLQLHAVLHNGGDVKRSMQDFGLAYEDDEMDISGIVFDLAAHRKEKLTKESNGMEVDNSPTALSLEEEVFGGDDLMEAVRRIARDRRVSPWSALGMTILSVTSIIPTRMVIPAFVGDKYGSLNMIFGFSGQSGQGKGVSGSVVNMLPRRLATKDAFTLDIPRKNAVGSGEAIAALYVEAVALDEEDEKTGKKKRGLLTFAETAWINWSEVDKLTAVVNRTSSTLDAELRAFWSGEQLGSTTKTNSMFVDEGRYRGVGSVSIQPERAGGLFQNTAGGLIQRMEFFATNDPHAKKREPGEKRNHTVEYYDVSLPDFAPADGDRWAFPESLDAEKREFSYPESVACEIDDFRHQMLTAPESIDPLDTHKLFSRLKISAALAVLHGRLEVTLDDWDRSRAIQEHSRRTRVAIQAAARLATKKAAKSKGESDGIARAAAGITEKEEKSEYVQDVMERIVQKLDDKPKTEAMIAKNLTPKQRVNQAEALKLLKASGLIANEGNKFMLTASGEEYLAALAA